MNDFIKTHFEQFDLKRSISVKIKDPAQQYRGLEKEWGTTVKLSDWEVPKILNNAFPCSVRLSL